VEMLSGLAIGGIILYGGFQAIDGAITAGTVVAFVAALSNLFDPIQQLSQLYTTNQSGMAALEKIFQLLDVQPDLRDRPGAARLGRIKGEIAFEGVSFAYPRGRRASDPDAERVVDPGGGGREPAGSEALALGDVWLPILPGQT